MGVEGSSHGAPQVGFLLLGAPHGFSPPPRTYIYVGRGRLEHITTIVSRVRPPSIVYTPVIVLRCLGEALRESHHHHCHHAIVLTELIYFLDTMLDQEGEGRHRTERVQNSKVTYVRCLIGRS